MFNKDNKLTFKNICFFEEDDRFYFSVSYTYEVDNGKTIKELYIPKVELPISRNGDVSIKTECDRGYGGIRGDIRTMINFGSDVDLQLHSVDGVKYIEKTLEDTLTISEIEERLGYKVNIVGKNDLKTGHFCTLKSGHWPLLFGQ